MIKVIFKLSSMFVDKPKIHSIFVKEDVPAVSPINDDTGEKYVYTVGELFDIYQGQHQYIRDGRPPNVIPGPEMFEQWIFEKYIKNSGMMQRILETKYERIEM